MTKRKEQRVLTFDDEGKLTSGGLTRHEVFLHGYENVSDKGPMSPVPARFVQGGQVGSNRKK